MLPLLLLLASAQAPSRSADTAHVVIVATTDVHGHATAWDYYADQPFAGGLTRAATAIDSLRALYPGQVVVVDAGDLIQGEPFAAYFANIAPKHPHPILETMNRIGYDVGTPGNHEFNFGLPTLRRALADATFPYVSGNIYALPADTLLYPPYVVVRRVGVRVAVAGFTTPGVMVWDRENVRGQVRVGPIERSAPGIVRDMRRDADLAVVLIHSGMDGPSSYDTTGVGPEDVAARFAGFAERPDLVVVGHSHREMRDSVLGGVHFVQPKNYAQSITVTHVDLVRAGGAWRVARIRGDLVPLAKVAPQPRLTEQLARAQGEVRGWVATPLGEALGPMPATYARAEPSAIVNFINAVQRRRTGAQLSTTPAFNTNAGFDAGPVTLAEVANVYPYENTLKAIRISGDQLRRYLEQSATYFTSDSAGRVRLNDRVPGYNYDIVAGAIYQIDLSRPAGERIQRLAVGGRPVAPTDSFTLALNSYRQSGGGGYDMLKGAPIVYDRSENVRDVLADAVREAGRLDPAAYAQREWRIVPEAAARQARGLFEPARVAEPAGGRPRGKADSVFLRILTITDLHGALQPRTAEWAKGRSVGGVAAIKAMMDSAEARCGCPTIRLDAGDEMQGTLISNLAYGRPTVAALNRVGLDAAVIGDHDLDWSIDTLRARMKEARYPWLAANLVDSATGETPGWVRPWTIVERGGVRVGVVGWMTVETKGIQQPENTRGLLVPGDVSRLRAALAAVKAQHPDVTVIVAHAGAICDSLGCQGEIMDLARELGAGAADLIVAGHTHWLVRTTVAGTPIVEARSSGTALGIVDVTKTAQGLATSTRVESVYADSVTPDSALTRLVHEWGARADSLAARPVASLKLPLPHTEGEYPLGNLIADAQRNAARADVAIMNNGGIRADLPAGSVTYGKVFEVQPFQNALVVVRLTGAELKQVLEHVVKDGAPDAHVSGIVVRYDPRRHRGSRIREIRREGGRSIGNREPLTVAVNDYMAGGGSGFALLAQKPAQRTGIVDVDALVQYLQKRPQPVEAPSANRFRAEGR